MTMQGDCVPATVMRLSTAFTLPEQELMTLADTKPSASAMICPAKTVSPFATTAFAGLPMCWFNAKTNSPFGRYV